MTKKNFSFKKGFLQVPLGKVDEVKNDLMQSLNISSRAAWLRRLDGNVDPKASEIEAIEAVFHKHSIKNIWGD